ncbi:cell envelope-associated transcriptional attenuator LytR-CpsA-Psr [Geomicrobium sp. JCM 19037]|uniref:LCP family glycopolymer transferase n=1 Tax=Geomicrobium sp. JCM 19037 TaxID=1460634 RepID=UPI00045F11D1|nr:LCP family protein [Geomicrobium sp. JCM 19037]GAK02074.1 cell envelope-associated transcriptional attenuator LytR-CpsA-Psr [Geomicrobium sp. JCM 19037]
MKRIWWIVSIALAILLVAGGALFLYVYSSLSSTADDIYEPVERESQSLYRPKPADVDERDPISFLLLGLDAEEETSGRTDTMIVATVNQTKDSIQMVSIPRDTRTEIIGRNVEDKINHAYAFGGAKMAMDTVENLLDIPIDYVVTINMDGFQEMVDAVGGVTVNNAFNFEYDGFDFIEGPVELDGEAALAYVRMRYEDPQGDHGRNIRQRQVIEGVLQEGARISSVTRMDQILSAIGTNVETNLTFQEMTDLFAYQSARHQIEQQTLTGTATYIDSIYYLLVSDEQIAEVSESLQEHLEL